MKIKDIIKKGRHYQVWYTPIQIKWYTPKEMKEYERECLKMPGFNYGVEIRVFASKYGMKPLAKYKGREWDSIVRIK